MSREEFIKELNMSNGKDNHANRAYERVIHEYDRLTAEVERLRKEKKDRADVSVSLFSENRKLQAENAELEADKVEILEALRNLFDEQNDAPLERDRDTWEKSMEEAKTVLKKYGA